MPQQKIGWVKGKIVTKVSLTACCQPLKRNSFLQRIRRKEFSVNVSFVQKTLYQSNKRIHHVKLKGEVCYSA